MVFALDAKTGKATKQGRLEASDDYYASPVAGDGKVGCVEPVVTRPTTGPSR